MDDGRYRTRELLMLVIQLQTWPAPSLHSIWVTQTQTAPLTLPHALHCVNSALNYRVISLKLNVPCCYRGWLDSEKKNHYSKWCFKGPTLEFETLFRHTLNNLHSTNRSLPGTAWIANTTALASFPAGQVRLATLKINNRPVSLGRVLYMLSQILSIVQLVRSF